MKPNVPTRIIAQNSDTRNDVKLRQLTGHDEQSLIESKKLLPFQRSIYLLERVLSSAKNTDRISKLIRDLKVGDRMILMLLLRRLNFGNIIQCVITCPECKESMSVDINIDDLFKNDQHKPTLTVKNLLAGKITGVRMKVNNFNLVVRPVTGKDQLLLVCKQNKDSNYGDSYRMEDSRINAELLARMCVISCEPPLPHKISRKFLLSLSSKLESIDPFAEFNIQLSCPSCNYSFQTQFYPEEFFLNEIDLRGRQLDSDVHWIAFNYHWNEDTILSLPIRKRKTYLDYINKTLLETR